MPISSFDLISPKITLNYNGHNSHISRIGGFLSLCLIITLGFSIFYYVWSLVNPRNYSTFLYKENVDDNKYLQKINFSGINHFLQIYSHSSDGWFGNIDNRNIIIYAIKENNNIIKKNYISELSNVEHWLYDKCERINNISLYLFEDISNFIKNYTSSICIRFYYNPLTKKYYEFGYDGYVDPYLETNRINEKKYPFRIIIEKCVNNTFVNKDIGYICNSENNINKYFDVYNELFIYFSYNQILPINRHNQFKKSFYSISSTLNQISYFENNIIFLPIKIKKKELFKGHVDSLSYSINNHFEYQKSIDKERENLIGIYNLYLDNNILTYQIEFLSILDILSYIGGLIKIYFFIFKILNYINHRYIMIEDIQDLFKINSGIEIHFIESKDLASENIRHLTTKNFKINPLNTKDDFSRRLMRNFSPITNKKKYKIFEGVSPMAKFSSKKNMPIYPITIPNNKKNNLSKKNTYSFNINNIDKRKSYLSQVYLLRNKYNKDNSMFIKNNSYFENDESNNEIPSSHDKYKNNKSENNSIANQKEAYIKRETSKKSNNEYNPMKNKKTRKGGNNNLKNPSNRIKPEKIDNSHLNLKIVHRENNLRHKSINYSNPKKSLRNSFFNKNYFIKNSEIINDSSKQILFNNKNLLLNINKTQNDKNKFDENNCRASCIINTELATSTKNLNTCPCLGNNINGNIDVSAILKSLVKNKLKLEFPEGKEQFMINYIGKKFDNFDIIKYLFICNGKSENKIYLINSFRNKLLSEEHLYKSHISLYLLQKIFQIEETYKFDFKELYDNL
jgi:hypothetical protein